MANSLIKTPSESNYDEQQALLRSKIPLGTPGADLLTSQGFTDVGTAPTTLTKVKTGSTDPTGNPIYDVFSGGEHIKDPTDPRLKGIDIAGLPEGTAPSDFKSKFLPVKDTNPEEDVISDTTDDRSKIKKTADDIKAGLADFGIEPPEDKTDDLVNKQLEDLKKRQDEMDKRRAEDVAKLEQSYATATEEQKIAQEEAFARAEGRTRIGGFITKMETDDLQALQRKFRLENIALQGQKVGAIQAAQRAYDDQDFALAQTQLEVAQKAEQDLYNKKQDYFRNIQSMQAYYEKLNAPITKATEADQEQMLGWLNDAPSIIEALGIKNSDIMLGKITYGEVMTAYFDSPEYALKLRGEKADVLRKEDLADGGGNEVKISSSNKTELLGSGLSSTEISQIEKDVNQFGIDAVLEGIDDERQKKAIRSVYGIKEKVTREQLNTTVTQKVAQDGLKDAYTKEELIEFAKEAGFRSIWKSREAEIKNFLNSEKAKEKYIELLYEQYKSAGMAD